ncbi:glycosyltransferase family 4 protein [Candidatus Pacearchaeota archaeon]|nr:glycosyltransferase family 4 protein [Candidatus Pacearchaeota archaeon]
MKKSYKLLFVINDSQYFISHRLPLAVAAQNAGFEVHVAVPEGAAITTILNNGFTYHSVPLTRKGGKPWQELNSLIALVSLYRKLKPELVHHVTIKPMIYGGIAARLTRVQAVVNAVTGLGYVFIARGLKAVLLRSIVKAGYRMAFSHSNQRIIFQNPDDCAAFIKAGIVTKKDTVLIKGSGVDTSIFTILPESNATPLVILASRMLWDKGVKEFVTAAQELQANAVNVRFVLVGETDPGNPTAIPTSQLKAWNDSGVIDWWGQCVDMPSVLNKANIVCLPSYREGVPRVLIEAAACGRAIVTTDVPGCREIVRHGENGLLVPVRDSKAIANALRILIEDSTLRVQMGKKGREIVIKEFSQDRVVNETLAVYRELLRKLKL